MRIDCIANPEQAGRYQVIDHETGEDVRNVAWADTETGTYAVFRLRKRTMSDKADADLRRRHADGSFVLDEREGDFSIVDTTENPLKGALLALLEDPEVIEALARAINRRNGLGNPDALDHAADLPCHFPCGEI